MGFENLMIFFRKQKRKYRNIKQKEKGRYLDDSFIKFNILKILILKRLRKKGREQIMWQEEINKLFRMEGYEF